MIFKIACGILGKNSERKEFIDMKKIITIALASLLLVSAAGCANTTGNNVKSTVKPQTDASAGYENGETQNGTVDENGNIVAGTADFSPEQVDMSKVEGTELKSNSDSSSVKGTVGTADVEIKDAKLIEYNGEDVAVVSFKYKNNSDTEMPFTGSLKVEALQDGNTLTPTVVTGIEGITMMSMTENVAKGEEITVQMAFRLRDKNHPLEVNVSEFFVNENSTEGLTKVFGF